MLVGRVLAVGGGEFAGRAAAQRCVGAVRVEGALHRHAAALLLPSHSIGRQLSGVDTCRVCLKHRVLDHRGGAECDN